VHHPADHTAYIPAHVHTHPDRTAHIHTHPDRTAHYRDPDHPDPDPHTNVDTH
jgi:hypothetical protein